MIKNIEKENSQQMVPEGGTRMITTELQKDWVFEGWIEILSFLTLYRVEILFWMRACLQCLRASLFLGLGDLCPLSMVLKFLMLGIDVPVCSESFLFY